MEDTKPTVVKRGTWLYDNTVRKPVFIIELDCDYWYEFDEAEGRLEKDQKPLELNKDGILYYVAFDDGFRSPRTTGFQTIEEAQRAAEKEELPSSIEWE